MSSAAYQNDLRAIEEFSLDELIAVDEVLGRELFDRSRAASERMAGKR